MTAEPIGDSWTSRDVYLIREADVATVVARIRAQKAIAWTRLAAADILADRDADRR